MSVLPLPSQSEVERAFFDAMMAAGFNPGRIDADTKDFVRFDAPGDKKGRQNGFYKLKHGRFPVGWFGDWKTGEQHQWQHDFGRELTKKERADIKAEQRRLKAEAEVAREAKHREVAERASELWKKASTEVEAHPYLERKRIAVARGLRSMTAADGTSLLVVPMYAFDHAGKPQLTSLQMIADDGGKRFLKAGRVDGTFFSLKGDASLIVLCEGVATGFSIWQATGASVVCAFNSGNLIEVAKEFQRHRPNAQLLIAGDDDAIAPHDWAERGGGRPWVNAGAKKAEAAAKAVGCRWILPVFADGPDRGRTDFNDLHLREGEPVVRGQIIGAYRSVEPEDSEPGAELIEPEFAQDESWRQRLPKNSNGNPDGANVQGVALYIENHRLMRGRLAWNSFTQAVELDGNEMGDHHVAEFRRIMHADHFRSKKSDVADEMLAEARRHTHDPLKDYLTGIEWDGKARLDTWLADYAGADASPFVSTIGRKFMIGAVARALDPGSKMDTMLILEGEQGIGKSTMIRFLFQDRFFVDHLPDFHSKDSFQQLAGAWVVEVAELAALSKADVGDVKKFLSRVVDKFRPPFGRLPVSIPRRCVFVGSVNPEEGTGYLKDPTGGRRFWPVEVRAVNLDAILRDRDQLWAEAVAYYHEREPWHLTEQPIIEQAAQEQEARRDVDPWETAIRRYLADNVFDYVTIAQLMTGALNLGYDKQDPRALRRVGAILRGMKWKARGERQQGTMVKVYYSPSWWATQGNL
ncbi:VapE domain-containing protein [Sphingomonas baiyangensis]|uniref:Toprim domain-containing protein n=1 Tax=Sphingomonas baiyangensis TaxID=2572576 RepID=A0A4U1L169_9SPHN|nr:VapE domain-containing protein [Sphingomonas baiyangensis]TKD50561.1 hypothetical protein FBR43_07130 [Sphingomonas baiyangensis]